ncbi:hypothetical protein AVEN_134359-1 [Araneus ventricosus]|uniref:Uncharacterized protein n=1 Tax=Araneus ventricosus TaxID=182803 RepID=A0A4Y2K3V1_ARAVE|nr:hypothetical protein AVEN_134359-1 [Araneus ventricosus]
MAVSALSKREFMDYSRQHQQLVPAWFLFFGRCCWIFTVLNAIQVVGLHPVKRLLKPEGTVSVGLDLPFREAYRHIVLEQSTIVTLEGSVWTRESDVTMFCLFVYL